MLQSLLLCVKKMANKMLQSLLLCVKKIASKMLQSLLLCVKKNGKQDDPTIGLFIADA